MFRSSSIPVHFTREQAYEGKYVIQAEEQNCPTVDASAAAAESAAAGGNSLLS